MQELIGKKILKIFINEDYLCFKTDQGDISYAVQGDCCSSSYFHDFIGVRNLLENGPVKAVENADLEDVESDPNDYDVISVYGYKIITESENFGEVSAVFSFRNRSNGYYGGWIALTSVSSDALLEIQDDWIND